MNNIFFGAGCREIKGTKRLGTATPPSTIKASGPVQFAAGMKEDEENGGLLWPYAEGIHILSTACVLF